MDKVVVEIYGNKLRTRVCGLCWKGNKMLLVNHHGLYDYDFWAPPGGGIEFGQSVSQNLIREFQEETGLEIQVGEFRFVCEFIQTPLHAMELFFEVKVVGGSLATGKDPETDKKKQVIKEAKFLSVMEINVLPDKHKHGLFKLAKTAKNVNDLKGYWKI